MKLGRFHGLKRQPGSKNSDYRMSEGHTSAGQWRCTHATPTKIPYIYWWGELQSTAWMIPGYSSTVSDLIHFTILQQWLIDGESPGYPPLLPPWRSPEGPEEACPLVFYLFRCRYLASVDPASLGLYIIRAKLRQRKSLCKFLVRNRCFSPSLL